MTREGVLAWVSEAHDRKKASHLKSVENAFDWLDKHPQTQGDHFQSVMIEDVQAAIIHMDFRTSARIVLQPVKSSGDIGNGTGNTLQLSF